MTVINQNSISGITSFTSSGNGIEVFNSDGTTGSITGLSGVNVTGVITATTYKVGTGVTVDASGIHVAGVVTATSFSGDGSGLTGVASTDNIRTNTNATFLQNVNVSGTVTATSYAGDGSQLTGVASTDNIRTNTNATFLQNVNVTGAGITVGVTTITSSSLAVNGINYPAAGPLSNRNLIINGAMQVAQRGTSQASVSDGSNEGYQTLDRFALYYSNSAGGVCTISQDTDVPSNEGFSNSYKVDVTTADTSIDANHQIYVAHKIEAQNVRNSGWNYTSASSYITLSFWAKSSKAGTYCVAVRANDVGAKYYVFEYTLEANTWKKITHSIPGDSSLVINNDNDVGFELRWVLVTGTDRDDATANQWNATSVNNAATSNQVNFFDSTANDFYLTGVQLEVGSVATPFEHRNYGDELTRCKRYFQQLVTGELVGSKNTSTRMRITGKLMVEMRTAPTTTRTSNSVGFQGVGITISSNNTSAAQAAIQDVRCMGFDLDGFPTLDDRSYGGVATTNVVFQCSAEL